ncbi:MAG: hypothetical protein VX360_05475 [Actinomycetota bacterium]|nr:hypothetical protein [Acidimicrobiales bacterium]
MTQRHFLTPTTTRVFLASWKGTSRAGNIYEEDRVHASALWVLVCAYDCGYGSGGCDD